MIKLQPGSSVPSIIVGCFLSFGGILYGYDIGMISGVQAMAQFKKDYGTLKNESYEITAGRTSLIVSILSAGLFCGALSNAYIADRFGRRPGLVTACCIFSFGVILQTINAGVALFVVGRFFAGWGAGSVSSLGPLYQSEILSKKLRGPIVAGYHQAITLGVFLAAVINNATKNKTGRSCYLIPICVQFVWASLLLIGLTFIPESPRYYVKKDNTAAALKALAYMRYLSVNDQEIKDEVTEIQINLDYERSFGKASVSDCFRRENRQLHRLTMGMGVMAFQQLAGQNFIKYFGTEYFQGAGISNSFVVSMAINSVSVGMTLPSVYLIERFGRRNLLIFGAIGNFLTQYIIAIIGIVTNSAVSNKILVAFSCLFTASESVSWGPTPWVLVGESFPLRTRATSVAISGATNYLFNFAIAYATPYLVGTGPGNANLGNKVFFIWGSSCFAAAIFVYIWVFETKGLRLEQIDELYGCVKYAWNSPKFVPSEDLTQVSRVLNEKDTEIERVEHAT
ncbi:general substrate transporter [Dipodascopsis uninucleata]